MMCVKSLVKVVLVGLDLVVGLFVITVILWWFTPPGGF